MLIEERGQATSADMSSYKTGYILWGFFALIGAIELALPYPDLHSFTHMEPFFIALLAAYVIAASMRVRMDSMTWLILRAAAYSLTSVFVSVALAITGSLPAHLWHDYVLALLYIASVIGWMLVWRKANRSAHTA